MKKELKIGILAIVVAVASFFVINFLRGKDVLNREMNVTGHFTDVEGLVASAPVQYKGFPVGHVSSIDYRPETDDFAVTCSVRKEYKIATDSRMVIYATSIMGTKGVRIEPGTGSEMVKAGALLETGSEPDLVSSLTAIAGPLVDRLGSTLDTLTVVLNNVNGVLNDQNKASIQASLRHLNSTLASVSSLAASLDGKSEEINAIVDNLKALSEKLNPILETTQGTMANIESISAQLNEADLKNTVNNIGKAVDDIGGTISNLSQPLDSMLNDVDRLVKNINENPKKYIKISIF